MSRSGMDSTQIAGVSAKVVPALFFARLEFPSTPVYVHNGIGPITFGGHTYVGIYDYAMLDTVEETIENRPADIRIGIQRVPNSVIDPVINEKYHGKDVFIYYSVADAAGQPLTTPFEIWRGSMDVITLSATPEGLQYILRCTNVMANWNRTKVRRITDAEQQRRYPGDTAYRYLSENEDKRVIWGPEPKVDPGRFPGNPRFPKRSPNN